METHVERPKAQRRMEDLSPAHTLRVVSVGRLRGFAIGQRSFTDGRLLAGQPFDGKLRSIRDVGFRENVADAIAYRTFA